MIILKMTLKIQLNVKIKLLMITTIFFGIIHKLTNKLCHSLAILMQLYIHHVMLLLKQLKQIVLFELTNQLLRYAIILFNFLEQYFQLYGVNVILDKFIWLLIINYTKLKVYHNYLNLLLTMQLKHHNMLQIKNQIQNFTSFI